MGKRGATKTTDYYGFDGEPLTLSEWVKLTTVNHHFVSTVWLGIFGGPPLIFETMVFCKHDEGCGWDDECRRYATKQEALLGHANMCNEIKGENHDDE